MSLNRLPSIPYKTGVAGLYVVIRCDAGWWVTGSTFSGAVADAKIILLADGDGIGDYRPSDAADLTGLPAGDYAYYGFKKAGADPDVAADAPYVYRDDDWRWDGDSGETLEETVEDGAGAAITAAGGSGGSGGGGGGGSSATMTLTEARAVVLQFARNASGSTSPYEPDEVDRAIQFVGNHFARATGNLRKLSTITLAAGVAAINVSGWGGFRPEMVLEAYADGVADAVSLTSWDNLRRLQVRCAATGAPRFLAFDTWSTGSVHPTPDQEYTLKIQWRPPFTAWTAGTDTPDDVILNIPTDWLNEILPYGPPAVLQHNEVESRYASESWKKYLAIVESLRGEGDMAVRVVPRAAAW